MPTLRAGDFRAGEPVELALKCTSSRYVAGAYGPQAMFTTSLGRLYLDPELASNIEAQVRDLAIAPGETIRVMRMGKPHGGYGWEVRRVEAAVGQQPLKSPESPEPNGQSAAAGAESPGAASVVTKTKAAETKAAAADVTSTKVTAAQDDSQQHSGYTPAAPVIAAGTVKLMACFMQAIDAATKAQVYCSRKGLGITFTSGDVRATAISCYINCSREGR